MFIVINMFWPCAVYVGSSPDQRTHPQPLALSIEHVVWLSVAAFVELA